jgi:hypothetical protein
MPLFDPKDQSRYATFTRRTLMLSGGVAHSGTTARWREASVG